MTVFFTSDTHFGHAAVIKHCKRPFASAEEMDDALIEKWNATIKPEDTVYHLGDFSLRATRPLDDYRRALHGTIHLIAGNHDAPLTENVTRQFASVSSISEIWLKDIRIFLCHYPLREWNGCWSGAWHLFGHLHGRLDHEPLGYSLDVGVDSNEYRPWALEEIEALFATRENPFSYTRRSPVKKTIREP